MYKVLITTLLSFALLTGCATFTGSSTRASTTTTATTPSGVVIKQESYGKSSAHGGSTEAGEVVTPEMSLEVGSDGTVIAKTGKGGSTGFAGSQLTQSLLQWPIIIGFALFAIGVGLWIFLPVKKVGMTVAIAGLAMATVAYLLAAYAWIIGLLALALVIGVGLYIVYKYRVSHRGNTEMVESLETIKERYLTDDERKTAFTGKTAEIPGRQSSTTRKLVRGLRRERGWTNS